MENAIVYCEGAFGTLDGKTANGLVRYSEKYRIVGVIDSTKRGKDAGEVLDGVSNGIKIYGSLEEALEDIKEPVRYFIYGVAPNSPFLPRKDMKVVREAIRNKMNIVIGMMNYLSENSELMKEAKMNGVKIFDIRKPPSMRKLHIFTGKISTVASPVIAVLGTDTAVGKRTTAIILHNALKKAGIKSAFVATGQTGLMQGAKYGIALDAIPGDFLPGEVEHSVVSAYESEHPEVIIVEGQSALGHPAFIGSFAIMKGARPDGVILVHAPMRKFYCDYPDIPMTTLEREIKLVEAISDALIVGIAIKGKKHPENRVMGIAINHEGMDRESVLKKIEEYEKKFGIPATDPLYFGVDKFVEKIKEVFIK